MDMIQFGHSRDAFMDIQIGNSVSIVIMFWAPVTKSNGTFYSLLWFDYQFSDQIAT